MTALDRVGIRRLLMYVEKRLRALIRQQLAQHLASDELEHMCHNFMLEVVEAGGLYDYWLVGEKQGFLVGVQFRDFSEWVTIEVNVCES